MNYNEIVYVLTDEQVAALCVVFDEENRYAHPEKYLGTRDTSEHSIVSVKIAR